MRVMVYSYVGHAQRKVIMFVSAEGTKTLNTTLATNVMQIDKFRNKIGHVVIPCSRSMVVIYFGGFGICDSCSETDEEGFLIPVLGHKWYCRKCKTEWEGHAEFYPEDVEYENRVALQMLEILEDERNMENN